MTRVWVNCPICGEDGMRKELETDAEVADENCSDGYITCTNLCCGSNGGSNFNAVPKPPRGPTFAERFARAVKAFAKAF
jgi:hypothetical protein